jgi:hypothetical protein
LDEVTCVLHEVGVVVFYGHQGIGLGAIQDWLQDVKGKTAAFGNLEKFKMLNIRKSNLT